MLDVSLTATGTKRVALKFRRMGAAGGTARPAFVKIAEYLFGIEERTFSGQGRRGGGSWRRDTPEWMDRKLKMGLDPRINFATHALVDSVTKPGAEGQILEMTNSTLRFGSKLPYAATTQRNRPFIALLPQDRLAIRAMFAAHFTGAFRKAEV